MDTYDDLVDIIIAILVIFLFPLLYFGLKQEAIIQTVVSAKTTELVDEIRSNGFLTRERYDEYLEELSKTGRIYDVSIRHRQLVHEPEYRFRTPEEVIEEQDLAYTGSNQYTYRPITTEVPAVSDPINNGNLNTETNESILAGAVRTPASGSHVHTDECYVGGHKHNDSCYMYTGAMSGGIYDNQGGGIYNGSYWDDSYAGNIYYTEKTARINDDYGGDGNRLYYFYFYEEYGPNDYRGWNNSYINMAYYQVDGSGNVYQKNELIQKIELSSTYKEGWNYYSPTGYYYRLNPEWVSYWGGFETFMENYNTKKVWIGGSWHFTEIFDLPGGKGKFIGNPFLGVYPALTCVQEEKTMCNQIVTSITPTHPLQTVYVREPLITTVTATYMDGSTNTVLGSTSFNTNTPGQNKPANISYMDEAGNILICQATVTVIPHTKTCENGHVYNLNEDSTDPGCPYCRAWLRSLEVVVPTSRTITIFKGTTLSDNGVTLLATYLDGRTEYLYNGYVDNMDTQYVGTQNVTISYQGKYTYLTVTTKRNLTQCSVCYRFYELYPDGSDPGCPFCKSLTPIFTGNVMDYHLDSYTNDILRELYEKSGIYYFTDRDYLLITVEDIKGSWGRKILSYIHENLKESSIQTIYGGYIRENGYMN
jgi:hypothetical protein